MLKISETLANNWLKADFVEAAGGELHGGLRARASVHARVVGILVRPAA